MTLINKSIEFTTPEAHNLAEKTINYFRQSGFKPVSAGDNHLRFKRGSVASNMWTFNPLKWKSEINIEIIGQQVKADFEIDTIGQVTSPKEEELWSMFIDNYRRYITEGVDFRAENASALRATKKDSLKYIGWAIAGGLMGGIPAGIIAYLTGITSIVSVCAAVGAITMLTNKIEEDKKKNAL